MRELVLAQELAHSMASALVQVQELAHSMASALVQVQELVRSTSALVLARALAQVPEPLLLPL